MWRNKIRGLNVSFCLCKREEGVNLSSKVYFDIVGAKVWSPFTRLSIYHDILTDSPFSPMKPLQSWS